MVQGANLKIKPTNTFMLLVSDLWNEKYNFKTKPTFHHIIVHKYNVSMVGQSGTVKKKKKIANACKLIFVSGYGKNTLT